MASFTHCTPHCVKLTKVSTHVTYCHTKLHITRGILVSLLSDASLDIGIYWLLMIILHNIDVFCKYSGGNGIGCIIDRGSFKGMGWCFIVIIWSSVINSARHFIQHPCAVAIHTVLHIFSAIYTCFCVCHGSRMLGACKVSWPPGGPRKGGY